MGTDIYLYAEKWSGNKWILASGLEKNPYYVPGDTTEEEYTLSEIDVGRNYALFTLLAGVRSRHGIKPISLPRGLPEDACKEITNAYAYWKEDSFSGSWLSADELYACDWNRIFQLTGEVDKRAEHLFRNNPLGFPSKNWPKDVQRSAALFMRDGVEVQWQETLGDLCDWKGLKPKIESFSKTERIRLVFWFGH